MTTPTTPTTLPPTLQSLFRETDTGERQAHLHSTLQTRVLENELAQLKIPYRTKIVKSRKAGYGFTITLPPQATPTTGHAHTPQATHGA